MQQLTVFSGFVSIYRMRKTKLWNQHKREKKIRWIRKASNAINAGGFNGFIQIKQSSKTITLRLMESFFRTKRNKVVLILELIFFGKLNKIEELVLRVIIYWLILLMKGDLFFWSSLSLNRNAERFSALYMILCL